MLIHRSLLHLLKSHIDVLWEFTEQIHFNLYTSTSRSSLVLKSKIHLQGFSIAEAKEKIVFLPKKICRSKGNEIHVMVVVVFFSSLNRGSHLSVLIV